MEKGIRMKIETSCHISCGYAYYRIWNTTFCCNKFKEECTMELGKIQAGSELLDYLKGSNASYCPFCKEVLEWVSKK